LSISVVDAVDVILNECGPHRFPDLIDSLQEIAEQSNHPHSEAANDLLLKFFPSGEEQD
jgi:hypothetical protein